MSNPEIIAKITVLMPVYNTKEEYLREAIESVLNQTFGDFEFLIINDGSTNNAEEVILSYKDARIKYVKNEQNLRLIKTLNKGLELAKGEFIARMDADDISLPTRLEKQIEFFEKHPETDVLGTWFEWFPKHKIVKTSTTDKEIKECMLVNSNDIGHPTVMFKKSLVEKFNTKYNENCLHVEDYALWLSLIDKANFANIQEVLLKYRIHGSNICKTSGVGQSLNVQKIMTEAQGKFFGVDNEKMIETVNKLIQGEKINSSELEEINNFALLVQTKAEEKGFGCEFELDREFYKYALKQCKKDLKFYKILWFGKLNKNLRIKLSHKLLNSI